MVGQLVTTQINVAPPQCFHELESTEPWHLHIGEHAVERPCIAELGQCALTVSRNDNVPTVGGEDARAHAAHHRIIINNEDATECRALHEGKPFCLCAAG